MDNLKSFRSFLILAIFLIGILRPVQASSVEKGLSLGELEAAPTPETSIPLAPDGAQVSLMTDKWGIPSALLEWHEHQLSEFQRREYWFTGESPVSFTDLAVGWSTTDRTPNPAGFEGIIRTGYGRQSWGEWIPIEVDTSPDENPSGLFWGKLYAPGDLDLYTHFDVRIRTPISVSLALVRIAVADTGAGLIVAGCLEDVMVYRENVEERADYPRPYVITRSEWWGNLPAGELDCPRLVPNYKDVSHAIIHHTDTANNPSNPAQVVRSIWNYHVNTNGWGDIGYNFLIDQYGNIYQGRCNPYLDMQDIRGAHALGHNSGSMGVAFIGQFQPGSSPAAAEPDSRALRGADELIAWKFDQRDLDPLEQATLSSSFVYRICGHRDVGSTSCPGDNLYGELPTIRSNVRNLLNTPPPPPELASPEDGAVFIDCPPSMLDWWYSYDPEDGLDVDYQVEVNGVPSDWQPFIAWFTPMEWCYQYGTYYWKVKARDKAGAESPWSEAWHFVTRPNSPPNTPSDGFPVDNGEGLAPTLCWRNNGDPDGDPVEFYGEVSQNGDPKATRDWFRPSSNPVCWTPSELDGRDGSYQWRVRARDILPNYPFHHPYHTYSDWSPYWEFTIQTNKMPVITLTHANDRVVTHNKQNIWSNERNWTFYGTATDSDGSVVRVVYNCSGNSCSESNVLVDGTDNWRHSRNGVEGSNYVSFYAIDNEGARSSEEDRHAVNLLIDLAAPVTTLSLNDVAIPARWPTWFTAPVQVRICAEDSATGDARSGVREIHYRLDGGSWQVQSSGCVTFMVNGDGPHTAEYYAVDNVGNQETIKHASFEIDQTPPDPLSESDVFETHGVISGTWQKVVNSPVFTWAASSDATSGVWGYEVVFRDEQGVVIADVFREADERQFAPGPLRTGDYDLHIRPGDNAGNWGDWPTSSLFDFRYDGTPPENPTGVTHTAGITNGTWQRTTSLPDFVWPKPHDEGSGIKGYFVYWGTDPAGTSTDFIVDNRFQSGTQLCGANEACTGYLRLRSLDNVDHEAENWTTAFVLRYDNALPTVDFTFNGGVTETAQTLVTVNIAASDEGSGVQAMRISGDGENWTSWEAYETERLWAIPGIGRQWWPVYLQVRDYVGLESAIISHAVYLDVNRRQPISANFRLFDHALSAGAGAHTSTGYTSHSTLGRVVGSAWLTSANYSLVGGYEAGSHAIPIVEPGYDEFDFVNGIFASGTGATTITSIHYLIQGMMGEVGLPNNTTIVTSTGFHHWPGFLAAAPSTPSIQVSDPAPGPTPIPEPTPPCESPHVNIDDAALFTRDTDVMLDICAPRAVEMMISNDGGFTGVEWEPYVESKPWTLATYGQYVLPCFVYVAFKDVSGTTYGTYFDDIVLDPNPPSGTVSTTGLPPLEGPGRADARRDGVLSGSAFYSVGLVNQAVPLLLADGFGTIRLYVSGQDDNSGLVEMQFSDGPDFGNTGWESYSALKPWTPTGEDGLKTVYVRFRDSAGNVSTPASASFVLDTLPPQGDIAIAQRVVGLRAINVILGLNAADNLSGVADMRVSADPGFTDAVWQAYTSTLTWPIYLTEEAQETLYVQYRDLAGNASQVYSDTYVMDATPPEVFLKVTLGDTLSRTITVLANDVYAKVSTMHLSNDPRMIERVATLPYTETVSWIFDERRVVWVQVEDSVGNISEPHAAYAVLPSVAGFTASPTIGNSPLAVDFTNLSTGDYDTCTWRFGDGGISNDCNDSSHIYTSAGVYTVNLTVNGLGGSDTETRVDCITVYEPPIAEFRASPTSGPAPLGVGFTNLSAGAYDTCAWFFGDGATSSDCSDPSHTYTAVGVYTATLAVSGLGGSDTRTHTNHISVYEPGDANFWGGPTEGRAPLTVAFTNISTGDYPDSLWNFGDGVTSTLKNPTHTYTAAGAYTVTLMISGPSGTDTVTRANYIIVYEPPMAGFSANPTNGPAPLAVSFNNLSTGDYETCEWTFGDGGTSSDCDDPGYTYSMVGVYTVTLAVSGSGGSDAVTKVDYVTVYEPSMADFSASPPRGPVPLKVDFTNLSTGDYDTCTWIFGDGDTGSDCGDPSHTYIAAGVYTVTLTVRWSGGSATVAKANYIAVYEPPTADFSARPTGGPAPLTVNFTNLSTGDYHTCAWIFGDGSISRACDDPSHTYTMAGAYTVILAAGGLGGNDIEAKTGYITVSAPESWGYSVYLPVLLRDSP